MKAWAAINKMIHQGRSWSGRERNVCLLNTADGRFADASAAFGADYIDDARGAALTDWDFDGDLDLWLSNRTAPQVRYVQNRLGQANHFLAVRLEGDGAACNRDAIGARLELTLSGDATRPLVKSVRAGEGMVSQSTKWVHFGLGANDAIERLRIRWPDGRVDELVGLAANRHYKIRHGDEGARVWSPPRAAVELAATEQTPPPSAATRTLLVSRVPVPELSHQNFDGTTSIVGRGPVLINLWATWCAPCLTELAEFASAQERLRSHGVDVVALAVDGLDEDAEEPQAVVQRVLEELGFPFTAGMATQELIVQLDALQRGVIAQQRPLQVPTSFLIDSEGRLAAIYRGRAEVDTIIADAAWLDDSPAERRAQAAPFAGRWLGPPPASSPMAVVQALIDTGDLELSRRYLTRCQNFYTQSSDSSESAAPAHHELAHVHYFLGSILQDQGKLAESAQAYRDALGVDPNYSAARFALAKVLLREHDLDGAAREFTLAIEQQPDDAEALNYLGVVHTRQGRLAEAANDYQRAALASPDDAGIRFHLAAALQSNGRAAEAAQAYREALRLNPGWIAAANNLAWLLATCPDDAVRNGAEAVRLAEQVVQSAAGEPTAFDTLSAAYAEAGRFEEAVAAAERALQLAGAREDEALLEKIRDRLKRFRANTPFRGSSSAHQM